MKQSYEKLKKRNQLSAYNRATRTLTDYIELIRTNQRVNTTTLREEIKNQIDAVVSPAFAAHSYREKLLAIVENRDTLPTCKTCGKATAFTNSSTKDGQINRFNEFCNTTCRNRYCPVEIALSEADLRINLADLSSQQLRTLPLRDPQLYGALVKATNYCVPTNKSNDKLGVTIMQRVWHVMHPDVKIPLCVECSMPTKWDPKTAQYCRYCGPNCSSSSWTQSEKKSRTMTKEVRDCLSNKDWFYDQHIVQQKSFQQIRAENNIAVAYTMSYWAKKHGIQNQQYSLSFQQRILVEWLEQQGIEVLVNNRQIIKPRELDIVLPAHNIAIEYGSYYFHSVGDLPHLKRITPNYHLNKWKSCAAVGFTLLTLFDATDTLDQCKKQIMVAINKEDTPMNKGNLRYYHSSHSDAVKILPPKIIQTRDIAVVGKDDRVVLELYDCGTAI